MVCRGSDIILYNKYNTVVTIELSEEKFSENNAGNVCKLSLAIRMCTRQNNYYEQYYSFTTPFPEIGRIWRTVYELWNTRHRAAMVYKLCKKNF